MVLNEYDFDGSNYVALELIKKTEDDWLPNLENNTIKVRVSFRPDAFHNEYIVYFCAIGGGQYRYELEYKTTVKKEAKEKFNYWAKILSELPENVSKSTFIELKLVEKTS